MDDTFSDINKKIKSFMGLLFKYTRKQASFLNFLYLQFVILFSFKLYVSELELLRLGV